MIKTKRFIFKEAQAGPVSDENNETNTAHCQGHCRGVGGGWEECIRNRESPVPYRARKVMRIIVLRSKRLHPWRAVEVHVVVTAMGGGRNMLPKRVG